MVYLVSEEPEVVLSDSMDPREVFSGFRGKPIGLVKRCNLGKDGARKPYYQGRLTIEPVENDSGDVEYVYSIRRDNGKFIAIDFGDGVFLRNPPYVRTRERA